MKFEHKYKELIGECFNRPIVEATSGTKLYLVSRWVEDWNERIYHGIFTTEEEAIIGANSLISDFDVTVREMVVDKTYELDGGENIYTVTFEENVPKYVISPPTDNVFVVVSVNENKMRSLTFYGLYSTIETAETVLNEVQENDPNAMIVQHDVGRMHNGNDGFHFNFK
jgi:hypothetical protein